MEKLCACGCGLPAPLSKATRKSRVNGVLYQYTKGQPVRFRPGHGKRTHQMSNSPEFWAYHDARKRCANLEDKDYGGRGIRFLFTSFEQFLTEIGVKTAPHYTLDRINNNGNYEPGNVHWATRKEQSANRRCSA